MIKTLEDAQHFSQCLVKAINSYDSGAALCKPEYFPQDTKKVGRFQDTSLYFKRVIWRDRGFKYYLHKKPYTLNDIPVRLSTSYIKEIIPDDNLWRTRLVESLWHGCDMDDLKGYSTSKGKFYGDIDAFNRWVTKTAILEQKIFHLANGYKNNLTQSSK